MTHITQQLPVRKEVAALPGGEEKVNIWQNWKSDFGTNGFAGWEYFLAGKCLCVEFEMSFPRRRIEESGFWKGANNVLALISGR